MTRPRILLLTVLLLAPSLATLPSGAAFTQGAEVEKAFWGTSPSGVEPGERGRTLTVQFRNADTTDFYAVEAELLDHPDVTPAYEGAETVHRAEDLDGGDVWQASFTVDLSDNLTVGQRVELQVRLTMRAVAGGATWSADQYRQETFDMDLPIPGITRLDLTAPRTHLPADAGTTLDLTLTNIGTGTAGTLEVRVAPTSTSTLNVRSPQAPVRLGDLAPGEQATLPVTLLAPSATGTQLLEVAVDHVDTVGQTTTTTFELPLSVTYRSQDPVQARLATSVATAGRVNDLRLELTNREDHPIEGLEATLSIGSATSGAVTTASATWAAPLNGSGVQQIGDLAAGGTTTLTIPLYVSREAPDLIPLQLQLSWTDTEGVAQATDRTYGLVVAGAIDLQITDQVAFLDATAGRLTVEGTLINTGNTPATNAYVRVMPADGVEGTQPLYQGDLDPDSPFPFSLETSATGRPAEVQVLLTWTDDHGRSRQLTSQAPVTEAQPASRPSGDGSGQGGSPIPSTGWLVVGAALALGAWALLRARKER